MSAITRTTDGIEAAEVDVRGIAFTYTRLAIFALAATALVIVTGAHSFTKASTLDPILPAPERASG